jgi:4-amino-4-deoxy-L-arabinose transferase-like glycosyltransferase
MTKQKIYNFKFKIVHILIYLSILVIAIILRFYQLGNIPPGVNRDEAALGYNAFSILKTGRDEYGKYFPISFESFGDWKLPAYVYLTIPFIKIFGLSDFSVRLLSSIAGIVTIALTPLLCYLLFENITISLLSMFMIAIAPWHIHFSRIAYEANLAVCFVTIGSICLLKSFSNDKKLWLLIISAIFFALTLYTYHGNHIFSVLLIVTSIIIYFQKLKKNRYSIISLLIFLILSAIIFSITIFGADKTKISGIGILSSPGIVHEKIEIPRNEHSDPNNPFVKLVHNKYTLVVETVIFNYISSFSPEFLFTRGGTNHSHNIEGFGNLYYLDSVFIFIGIIVMIKNFRNKNFLFVLGWFFISPIAGSITKDAPHSARMFAVFPILSIVSGLGIYTLLRINVSPKFIKNIFIFIISVLLVLNIVKYLDLYFIHFPLNESTYWGDGYQKINILLQKPEYSSKQIFFNHPEYSPYIFMLFYSNFNPKVYQQTSQKYPPTSDAFIHVKQYDRFKFGYNFPPDKQANTTYIDLNMLDNLSVKTNNIRGIVVSSSNHVFANISN